MSVTTAIDSAQQRVAAFRRYRPGRAPLSNAGKLSSNEPPLGPAPEVRRAVDDAMNNVNRYPEAAELGSALAARAGVKDCQVVLTNGSDELCYLVAALFIAPGASVVLSDPCYQIDELVSRLQGAEPELVELRSDGSHDLEMMAERAENAAVLWLPSPHNPTGVVTAPDDLERLLRSVPDTCIVVLDEAYRAFVAPELRPDVTRLIAEHPNLLVQRTFSKDYALAGLRIGYGIGNPALIDALTRIKAPFNVNIAAAAAARAALANEDWHRLSIDMVLRERRLLEQALTELGVEFFASQANFVTFRVADPEALHEALNQSGLMVRDGVDLGLPGWVRVSVGGPPAMARLRAVLRKSL